MYRLPEIVTHTFHPDRGPCRNICDLPRPEAEGILAEMRASGRRGLSSNYLDRRYATEAWLIREKTAKLGATRLERPVYFFLGDVADGLDPARPSALVMPLSSFAVETLTFTCSDSMTCASLDPADPRRQVHTLREIENMVSKLGMPGPPGGSEHRRLGDPFIEMQIWDDAPVRAALSGQGVGAWISG